MKKHLLILICITITFISGCEKEGSAALPQKEKVNAEVEQLGYDMSKFGALHIPKNCKIIAHINTKGIVIENGSGSQFVTGITTDMEVPYRVIKDLPEIW